MSREVPCTAHIAYLTLTPVGARGEREWSTGRRTLHTVQIWERCLFWLHPEAKGWASCGSLMRTLSTFQRAHPLTPSHWGVHTGFEHMTSSREEQTLSGLVVTTTFCSSWVQQNILYYLSFLSKDFYRTMTSPWWSAFIKFHDSAQLQRLCFTLRYLYWRHWPWVFNSCFLYQIVFLMCCVLINLVKNLHKEVVIVAKPKNHTNCHNA